MTQSDGEPPFNAAELWQIAMEDRGLLEELIALFLEELPKQLLAVRQAHVQGDQRTLRAAAHRLRGSLVNVAAAPAGHIADQVLALARGSETVGMGELVDALETEAQRLARALRTHGAAAGD